MTFLLAVALHDVGFLFLLLPQMNKLRELEAHCAQHEEQRPFVTLTYAQSLDGCIALKTPSTEPLILSSKESMVLTHELRAFHDGILVGVGTVVADNPSLTTRLVPGQDPRPIILDPQLIVPLDCKLLLQRSVNKVIVVCDSTQNELKTARLKALESLQITVIVEDKLPTMLAKLRQEFGIKRIMAEGGARVIRSFMDQPTLVDCVLITIAPFFLGGSGLAPSHQISKSLTTLPRINILSSTLLGGDVIICGVFQ